MLSFLFAALIPLATPAAAQANDFAGTIEATLQACTNAMTTRQATCPTLEKVNLSGHSLQEMKNEIEDRRRIVLKRGDFDKASAVLGTSFLRHSRLANPSEALALGRTERVLKSYVYNAMTGGYVAFIGEDTVVLIHPTKGGALVIMHGES